MKKKKALTLIEIMAAIGIASLVILASLNLFNAPKRNVNLRAAQREVASAIRLAQSYALQGKMPSGETTICGWGFQSNANGTSYSIIYYENNCTNPNSSSYRLVEMQNLKNGVTISPTTTRVFFAIPLGKVAFSSPSGSATFTLSQGGENMTVSVNSAGMITEQ